MKSIEERAEEFASIYPHDMQHFLEECYITGATEQEKITKKEIIGKACEWLKLNYVHFDGKVEDLVSDFRKAMEE